MELDQHKEQTPCVHEVSVNLKTNFVIHLRSGMGKWYSTCKKKLYSLLYLNVLLVWIATCNVILFKLGYSREI